jgi:hypothetical protein
MAAVKPIYARRELGAAAFRAIEAQRVAALTDPKTGGTYERSAAGRVIGLGLINNDIAPAAGGRLWRAGYDIDGEVRRARADGRRAASSPKSHAAQARSSCACSIPTRPRTWWRTASLALGDGRADRAGDRSTGSRRRGAVAQRGLPDRHAGLGVERRVHRREVGLIGGDPQAAMTPRPC